MCECVRASESESESESENKSRTTRDNRERESARARARETWKERKRCLKLARGANDAAEKRRGEYAQEGRRECAALV